ncbi:MAG: hypothetical protein ACQEQV_10285, partial [Fibrobacterota bacterium]
NSEGPEMVLWPSVQEAEIILDSELDLIFVHFEVIGAGLMPRLRYVGIATDGAVPFPVAEKKPKCHS